MLHFLIGKKKDDERKVRHKIRGGYYNGILALKNEINAALKKIEVDVQLEIHPFKQSFQFQADGQWQLRFFAPLAYMLGVLPGEWILFNKKSAPFPGDAKAGFYHLYCYSDIVSHQIVGDAYAPLLRTLPVRGVFGDIITQTFNPPNYVPVSKKHIENIQIQIKTDQNVPVNFSYGKTILRLHFRPIQRHINRE